MRTVAGTVWYTGAIVLMLKGGSLLFAANEIRPGEPWPWLAIATALAIGGLKTKLLFVNACRKNLDRIAALRRPKIWHAFRLRYPGSLKTTTPGCCLSQSSTSALQWLFLSAAESSGTTHRKPDAACPLLLIGRRIAIITQPCC